MKAFQRFIHDRYDLAFTMLKIKNGPTCFQRMSIEEALVLRKNSLPSEVPILLTSAFSYTLDSWEGVTRKVKRVRCNALGVAHEK